MQKRAQARLSMLFTKTCLQFIYIFIYVYKQDLAINNLNGWNVIKSDQSNYISPGGNTPQDTNCTATCLLSRKLFKLDEPDMQDTAWEAGTNS